jgi:hypothetical protein
MFLYFLTDKNNKSYVENANGTISAVVNPTPLKHKPIGWRELELSFDTVDKYFSNVKALSVPLQYVLDGAAIIRYLLYKGKGFEEEVYCTILKLNTETGIHELEYQARIDLSKAVDDPQIGITVNAKEGGFQSDLDANEDVTFEFPLDGTNRDAVNVLFDGIDLYDKYNYSFFEIPLFSTQMVLPSLYQNNEGDSVGVISGSPSIEDLIGTPAGYFQDSANYLFSSVNAIKGVNIKGTISFKIDRTVNPSFNDQRIVVLLRTSLNHDYNLVPQNTVVTATNATFSFDVTIDLEANEKVFIGYGTIDIVSILILQESKFSISFVSRNSLSQAFAYQPLVLANLLVKKWNPKYSVQSNWLTAHNNIVATSGQALRNLPKPVLKYSFKDFWEDYNDEYCLCMNIIGNVMYIEKREIRFAGNPTNIIFDLGQFADFTISPDDSKIINTLKIGWPDQQYDERNGKFEFNSTIEEKAPVTAKKAELNLIGKGRGDAYGIEFIRGKLNNKDTTDNQADNETFLVNIVPQSQITDTFGIDWTASNKTLKLNGQAALIDRFPAGKIFETTTPYSVTFNNYIFTVVSATVNGADLDIVVNEAAPSTIAFFPGSILFPCKLTRVRYDDIIGVPVPVVDGLKRSDLAGAPFNIEEMTPYRRMKYWGSWLRSILFQLPAEKITFQTALKNADLKTVQPGLTILEKQDTQVSRLDAPFFLNYKGKFTTKVPLTFSKTLSTLNVAGVIKGTYHGFTLNFLPVGKMSSKPATNEAQEWELLLSANNDFDTILELSQTGPLLINDGMNNTLRASVLNPVHYVYYNKTLNAKYKYKDIFDDWVCHRNNQFAVQPGYTQKWEFTDYIKQQFVSVGLAQIDLYLYNSKAEEIDVISSTIVANQAVRSPYVLLQIDLDPSQYDEGLYIYVLKSGATTLLISEWQHFAPVQEGTYAIEYYNSYNLLNAYWATFKPMIRVEAMWGIEKWDGSSSDYKDETTFQVLHFDSDSTKPLRVGDPYGIPEWMQGKLNSILRLDRTLIEGTRITCSNDSKWEIDEPNGYPLRFCTIELKRYDNSMSLAVTDAGAADTEAAIIWTVEAEAFGQAPGVINIEVKPE